MSYSALKSTIDNSGLKIVYIAEQLGLSPQGLYNKLNGKTDFTASEIAMLKKILSLSEEEAWAIFFEPEVTEKSTRKEDPDAAV